MSEKKQDVPTPTLMTEADHHGGAINALVWMFLKSNLALVLILLSTVIGLAALLVTPREEDPQIVVPMADVLVSYPGRSAQEVERLVTTPLEKLLYEIDGVEHVYSMSQQDRAIITVRFYVGEDRERSLVKLYKRMDEHVDSVPAGVSGWVVKPVEIDDVPVVTLTLRSSGGSVEAGRRVAAEQPMQAVAQPGLDEYALRRVAEEMVARLATVKNLSRAYVIGGQPRVLHVYLDAAGLQARGLSPLQVQQALRVANIRLTAGEFTRHDQQFQVQVGDVLRDAREVGDLVVAVAQDRPVFLKDVARVVDGPAEATSYVRHGWGAGAGKFTHGDAGGSPLMVTQHEDEHTSVAAAIKHVDSQPAVTIALAKKKGSNAVTVAQAIIDEARKLQTQMMPAGVEVVITRNYGQTADHKVNELVEALFVAVVIVIALLTMSLGWREAVVVAVAVPVVFGLTLAVNQLLGFSINRVTLFALILSLGLLVDDPIVDVENITRHFALRKKATKRIVLEAVSEIRPPLISATLAVILSFIPMFFITGMMGPYMRPMALNVPVTMLMSMLVAFTITPWLAYHLLHKRYQADSTLPHETQHHEHDLEQVRQSFLWKLFYPLMAPLLHKRWLAWSFLIVTAVATVAAMGLAMTRHVPLKMLPFDNKNELNLVVDFDRGTTLERADGVVRQIETFLRSEPEVVDVTSYVGLSAPMDFNGLVRHYYLRQGPESAQLVVNLVPKKNRAYQSHGLALRWRDPQGVLAQLSQQTGARIKVVESPPGPPVISTLVAEVYGQPTHEYDDLRQASRFVKARLDREPAVVETDVSIEATQTQWRFVPDREKAMLSGISTETMAQTVQLVLQGETVGVLRAERERQPLMMVMRLPRAERSSVHDLSGLLVREGDGPMVALSELGRWEQQSVDATIYRKNLRPVVYVFGETAGRAPAEVVMDVMADRQSIHPADEPADVSPRPVHQRTFFNPGGGIPWSLPPGIDINFTGEGEWNITLDVFRDLGLAFGAALVAIYILLLWQTGSFVIPLVVMLAIPLTVLGVMPGFYLLNWFTGGQVGPFADPVFFTATAMIGMIALSGIVTRDSIILVDFIHLSLARGRSLFDAILESRVVRLRPILLTTGAAMLSAIPITIDPIFSGLAWALIFGLVASTLFTLFVIPVAYWLLYAHKPGHGLPVKES